MAVAPASTAGGRRLEPGRHSRGPFGGSTSHATLSSERVPAKDEIHRTGPLPVVPANGWKGA